MQATIYPSNCWSAATVTCGRQPAFCPHSLSVPLTISTHCSLHSIRRMIFLIAVHCVFCEVRTASLCIKWTDDQIQKVCRSASWRRTGEGSGDGFNYGYIKHDTVSSLFRHTYIQILLGPSMFLLFSWTVK